MPNFDDLDDAKGCIQEAWNALRGEGTIWTSINDDPVTITWRLRGGMMDAGVSQSYVFTGDQAALTAWWLSQGPGRSVLQRQWKQESRAYQINLIYTAGGGEPGFNYHLSVP